MGKSGDSADGEITRRLAGLLEPFRRQLDQKPPEVQPGSTLRRQDDVLGDPFRISQAVVGLHVRARDHLVASGNLLFRAGAMHPWASMTLARGALENAAAAAWLLEPSNDHERCYRALRFWAQDTQDQIEFEEKLGAEAERIAKLKNRRGRALAKASELEMDPGKVGSKLYWSTILDGVGGDLGPDEMTPHLMWKFLSGLAHGRTWASLAGLEVERIAEAGKTVTISLTAREPYLFAALATGADLLRRSQKTFDRDRLHWRSRPLAEPT